MLKRRQLINLNRLAREINSICTNKKAASVVVSTIILTAGVIAMSIAVLYWTYSMGKIGNIEYAQNTNATSSAVGERIGFEYVNASNVNSIPTLTAFVVNWGKSDNVAIAHVIILDSSYHYLGSNSTPIVLKNIDFPYAKIPDNKLHLGRDGFFTTSLYMQTQLNTNSLYYVRIITTSGRNFDGSFTA